MLFALTIGTLFAAALALGHLMGQKHQPVRIKYVGVVAVVYLSGPNLEPSEERIVCKTFSDARDALDYADSQGAIVSRFVPSDN